MACLSIYGQVILTEVMFDPSGPEGSAEYIEIYNAGFSSINLFGWEVGDQSSLDEIVDAGDGLELSTGQYAIILDPDDFEQQAGYYDDLIPADALILTIAGNTFGSRGLSNSTEETVILLNDVGDTVQVYQYSLDNVPGSSDEKIELLATNWPENWGNSTVGGTPGQRNSLTRYETDVAICRWQLLDRAPVAGGSLRWEVCLKNTGRLMVEAVALTVFSDDDGNGLPEPAEIYEERIISDALAVDDSIIVTGQISVLPYGAWSLGVAATLAGDENAENDVDTITVFVDDPQRWDIVINEIMFEPLPGTEEWIEIYNAGDQPIDLNTIYFADVRDTIRISQTSRLLNPDQYLVLAGDSAIFQQFMLEAQKVAISEGFPTLNNDVDDLTLLGPTLVPYDYLRYSDLWYRRDVEAGTSVEKLNPQFEGRLADNWAGSVAGATPGARNSIYLETVPLETDAFFEPNPFSPDGDGYDDFTALQFRVDSETAFVNARIFDLRGRLIRHLLSAEAVAANGRYIWDGRDEHGRTVRIGAYILLLEFLNPDKALYRTLKKSVVVMKQ